MSVSDRHSIRSVSSSASTLPTLEKFVYLLKKSLSSEQSLSAEERSDVQRVREQLTAEQWESFVRRAQEEKAYVAPLASNLLDGRAAVFQWGPSICLRAFG